MKGTTRYCYAARFDDVMPMKRGATMALEQFHRSTSKNSVQQILTHLAAGCVAIGGIQAAWGQDTSGSRWSTNNPPTPAMIETQSQSNDAELRRLPPIEEEGTTPAAQPQKSAATAEAKFAAAAKPTPSVTKPLADPVDWSNPSVVIGPEMANRPVSHEEIVAAPKPRKSRYSSAPQPDAAPATASSGSRFSQTAPVETPSPAAAETEKPSAAVFARVFDEEIESPVQEDPAMDQPEISQPELAETCGDLSPIFACRLLGLPKTQGEESAQR